MTGDFTVAPGRQDATIERYIVTAMIVSSDALRSIGALYREGYLLNAVTSTVAGWCVAYWDEYGVAPGRDIQTIYEAARRSGLEPELASLIGRFLVSLSEEHERAAAFNVGYAVDQAVVYFRERTLRLLHEGLGRFLDSGQLLQAEGAVAGYRELATPSGGGCEPLRDKDLVREAFAEDDDGLLVLPGALGQMVGKLERQWLLGVGAPYKRGKTFTMQYIAQQALLSSLNVAWFNLEMGNGQMVKRLMQGFAAMPLRAALNDVVLVPVWDCRHNQVGDCPNPQLRCNRAAVVRGAGTDGEQRASFADGVMLGYRPCAVCMGSNGGGFLADTWLEERRVSQLSWFTAWRKAQQVVAAVMGARLKLQTWPKFAAGMADIRQTLYIWETIEGFRPDVVIVDYPAILKPEGYERERHIVDRQWKELGGLAQEKHCLVVAASQSGGKDTLDRVSLRQKDVGEDSRILGHVDVMLAKNQTDREKLWHRARMAETAARSDDFNIVKEVIVLQQLGLGQPVLDSRFRGAGEKIL